LDLLRAVEEGGCAPDQEREGGLELLGKGFVVRAEADVVEDVIEDVENMEAAPPRRGLAGTGGGGGEERG